MSQELHDFLSDDQDGPQPGPSWQQNHWPITAPGSDDDLTSALDPMAMKLAIKKAAKQQGAPISEEAIEQAYKVSVN